MSLLNVLWHHPQYMHVVLNGLKLTWACRPCLQEVLGQLRKETAKVGKGGDEFVFAYVTALTAGLINRSCYDEEAWKEVGQALLVCYVGMTNNLICIMSWLPGIAVVVP